MDTEIKSKVMEIIASAEKVLPEVAQEYLAYGMVCHSVWLIVGIVILPIGIYLTYKAFTAKYGSKLYDADLEPLVGVLGVVLILIGITSAGINANELIKINTAPKVYIIDQLK
jgi:hypothetical protein